MEGQEHRSLGKGKDEAFETRSIPLRKEGMVPNHFQTWALFLSGVENPSFAHKC